MRLHLARLEPRNFPTSSQATISNDGAEILKLMDIVHPAAKTLVDVARAQDADCSAGNLDF